MCRVVVSYSGVLLVLAWASRCRFLLPKAMREPRFVERRRSNSTFFILYLSKLIYHRIVGSSYATKLIRMNNRNSSEELQSRREFFKKAVRAGCHHAYLGCRAGACMIVLATASLMCMPAYVKAQASNEPQPSIIIERLVGEDLTFALAKVGKLTFANDSIYLVAQAGNVLGREARAKTHKIIFGSGESLTAVPEASTGDIRVYPNPTSDYLTVSGLDGGSTIRIYANDGKLLETTTADDNTATLQVSHLTQGTYLLQINTTIIKFIKK